MSENRYDARNPKMQTAMQERVLLELANVTVAEAIEVLRAYLLEKRTPARYPTKPHAYICHGVHMPWPKKQLDTNAASAPVIKPSRLPNADPAITHIAVTG